MALEPTDLMDLKEASDWASRLLGKDVTVSNISYLIQYGLVRKYGETGSSFVSKSELDEYYHSNNKFREHRWRQELGEDLNWALSFEQYKESETTKHVHRLHPYKGKFIPQLVEYFLDQHVDRYKKEVFFEPGDIVLDPFAGSGTTLVEANELGINAVGIDVSAFNVMICGSKIKKYDFAELSFELDRITNALEWYLRDSKTVEFEDRLLAELYKFNKRYFPAPEYRRMVRTREIDVKTYSAEKEQEFLPIYNKLVDEYEIKLIAENPVSFMEKWFIQHIREEIDFVFNEIQKVETPSIRKILGIILSRTIRSCRATTHSDLATLMEPVTTTYYCRKHAKICKPLFSILKWWKRYSKDTLKRLKTFDGLRTNTRQACITGDSRNVDIVERVSNLDPFLGSMIKTQKFKGIFTSPPYVGLIDYHEQHAYAYDTFGFERHDELEIGPLYKGQGAQARESYAKGISDVLINCKRFLADDYHVFLVANDKYKLYPKIAEKAGMKIVNQYKRPVLNRTEKDKRAYSETIFHLKEAT